MNVDSHICQHHQHTKVYQPTNPITWIEMLPKDCIGCIRKFLAKQDFDKVLFQLQIATNSERQWIIDCTANPPEPCRVGEEAGALGPRARHRRGPCGPSLAPVQLYIEMYLSHAPILSKTWTEMMRAFRDCRWTGPEKNFHSASPIFQKLWDFIELHIGVVHQMIQNIKRSYRQSVAVPEDFIRRNGVYSSFVWPDTKAGFIQYINEDPVVGNYRNVIKGLLEKILSSGGWLRTIRYRSKEYKKELYTVCY